MTCINNADNFPMTCHNEHPICDLRSLLPILFDATQADVVFVEDNAKRPKDSLSEAYLQRRVIPRKNKPKSRWESGKTRSGSVRTRVEVDLGCVMENGPFMDEDEDEEEAALANAVAFFGGDVTNRSAPTPAFSFPVARKAHPDIAMRSSIEARKPCRRPSVDQEALREIAAELGDAPFRSSLEAKKPRRRDSDNDL